MKIRLEIDLGLSQAQKNVARWGVVLGVGVGALGLGVAFAWSDTGWIKAGQPVSAAALLQNLTELQTQIADPLCPPGYTLESGPSDGGAGVIVCQDGADEVVRVGLKASSFWIDRYEASVWSSPRAGQGDVQYGIASSNYPFPQSAQRGPSNGGFVPAYAVSKAGVPPSASITWFQALEACSASGKRLPTGEEWLRAASGTADPVATSDGSGGTCVIGRPLAQGPRVTGQATSCVSAWGAQDMIGNVGEWTGEWFAGLYDSDAGAGAPPAAWPSFPTAGYGGDGTFNVGSWAFTDNKGTYAPGVPAAALRGGTWAGAALAGVFTFDVALAPTAWDVRYGFRCVTPH